MLGRAMYSHESPLDESTSFYAKIYVDILMGTECALKSCIVSLSHKSESPEDAYFASRKGGHSIQKLYAEVATRAKNRVQLLKSSDYKILMRACTLGVGYRYGITTFMFLIQEDSFERIFNQGNVSSIINPDFILRFMDVAFQIKSIAWAMHNKYCGENKAMSGKNMKKYEDRQKNFYINVKNKL
ncbi:MAG: hypothetical protein JXQ90_05370 [Cyclobacteriaceae bacterium]